MLAIFESEAEAIIFSKKIHSFLTENRLRYNAERWSYPNKSDFKDKWMVKIPYDFEKWAKKLDIKEVKEKVEDKDIKDYLKEWYKLKI